MKRARVLEVLYGSESFHRDRYAKQDWAVTRMPLKSNRSGATPNGQ